MDRPFTEEDWSDPESSDNNAYSRSKTYAERAAWEYVGQTKSDLELTTVHPSAVLGPVLEQDYGTSDANPMDWSGSVTFLRVPARRTDE